MWWLKAVAVVVFLGLLVWWHQAQVSTAYASGQTTERLVWQERQARAEIEADRHRQETQALIKSVEADYWQKQAASEVRHRDKMAALEQMLIEERVNDEKPEAGKPAPIVCRPAVSKRVRDEINSFGSDPASGVDP